jgi:hypothetical protein
MYNILNYIMYYYVLCIIIMYYVLRNKCDLPCHEQNRYRGIIGRFFMEYLSYIIQSGAPVVKLFIVIHSTADTIWLFHIAMENHHF